MYDISVPSFDCTCSAIKRINKENNGLYIREFSWRKQRTRVQYTLNFQGEKTHVFATARCSRDEFFHRCNNGETPEWVLKKQGAIALWHKYMPQMQRRTRDESPLGEIAQYSNFGYSSVLSAFSRYEDEEDDAAEMDICRIAETHNGHTVVNTYKKYRDYGTSLSSTVQVMNGYCWNSFVNGKKKLFFGPHFLSRWLKREATLNTNLGYYQDQRWHRVYHYEYK